MPRQRIGLPKWLYQKIESEEYNGVSWVHRPDLTFKIPWKHASSNKWSLKQDAALFKDWAIHKGKFIEGQRANPKKWKATFRCALNASRSIVHFEDKTLESEGYKVFKFIIKSDGDSPAIKIKEENRSCAVPLKKIKADLRETHSDSYKGNTTSLIDQKKIIEKLPTNCADSCMGRKGKKDIEKGHKKILCKEEVEDMSTDSSLSEIIAALAKENEFQPAMYSSVNPTKTTMKSTQVNTFPQNNSRPSYNEYHSNICSSYERYPDLAQRLTHFNEYPSVSSENFRSNGSSPSDCSRSSSAISCYFNDDLYIAEDDFDANRNFNYSQSNDTKPHITELSKEVRQHREIEKPPPNAYHPKYAENINPYNFYDRNNNSSYNFVSSHCQYQFKMWSKYLMSGS